MNTDHPCIEALPLREESQAVLNSLAHITQSSELKTFYKVSAEKAEGEYAQYSGSKRSQAKTIQP